MNAPKRKDGVFLLSEVKLLSICQVNDIFYENVIKSIIFKSESVDQVVQWAAKLEQSVLGSGPSQEH